MQRGIEDFLFSTCQIKAILGEALLCGTRIYSDTVLPVMINSPSILGAAHITGGGIEENVARILPYNLTAVVVRYFNCSRIL